MVDPRHPHFHHQHAPPPIAASKAGMPTWLIAALVVGGVGVMGVGGLAIAGAFWYFAARQPSAPTAEGIVDGGIRADAGPSDDSARNSAQAANGTEEQTPDGVDPSPSNERRSEPGSSSGPTKAPSSGSGKWSCTASASVRVCGFANACNYQMVFGNGFGKDRFLASQQAKNACQASARAKGATAVCVVQCSAR